MSGWAVMSAILLQRGAEPLNAVSLILWSSPTALCTLILFFCSLELPHLINHVREPERPVPPVGDMVIYIAGGSLIATLYDVLHNQFIKLTSSVNMAIMGNAKLALLILLSMLTLERPPTATRIIGVTLAFSGVLWYSVFKACETEPP